MRTLHLASSLLFLGLFSGVAQAGPAVLVLAPEAHLEGASQSQFGSGLALDGDTCLVGAPKALGEVGEVTAFARANGAWSPTKLTNTTAGAGKQQLGAAVALLGDVAFVGAPGETADGAVHVYQRNPGDATWAFKQLIKSPVVSTPAARFGASLAFDGVTLVVGAPEESTAGTYAGRVFTFTLDAGTGSWAPQGNFTAEPVSSRFGASVSISGEHLIVGSPVDAGYAGKVFFFRNVGGSWQPGGTFSEPGGAKENRYFGAAVAIDKTTAFVGATAIQSTGPASVYRYTFDGTAWSPAGDKYEDGGLYFGASLRLREGKLAIGANGSQHPALYSEAPQGPWPLLASLTGTKGPLGAPIDISGELIAVSTSYGDGFVDVGTLRLGQGSDCAASAECASGFCVDGVCCNKACDEGPCQACSEAKGASIDGTCTLLGGSVTCRAAADGCDAAEVCFGTSPLCPDDKKLPDGSPCDAGMCVAGLCQPAGQGGAGGGGAGASGAGASGAGAGGAGAGGAGAAGKAGAGGSAGKASAGAGGSGGKAASGGAGQAGASPGTATEAVSEDEAACGCRAAGGPARAPAGLLLVGLLALSVRRRRAAPGR